MNQFNETLENLALLGGNKAVQTDQKDMFKWPIITEEHEKAVLDVLRSGNMSGIDITKQFEAKYAYNLGRKYALGCHNGTAAITGAMFGLGVGAGDEVIAPAITYWASILQAMNLGATPVFSDVDPYSLCIDPKDIERKITDRTKIIVVVHYSAMPADMDAIMVISNKYNIKVLEDCSHAHGTLYKGKEAGTFGAAAAFSLMSGKAFAIGEAGIMLTDDRKVYERAILFGHYIRHNEITIDEVKKYAGLPCGGVKHRMQQLNSALGLVQLKYYPDQMNEINQAMNYFCDAMENTPGVKPIRPSKDAGTSKGGWYFPLFHYKADQLGGLSLKRFTQAVRAEGTMCNPGSNHPLHLHPLFRNMDVYGHGRPTRIAQLPPGTEIDKYLESLPVSEKVFKQVFQVPWFKKYRPEIIDQHVRAYKKVIQNYKILLKEDSQENRDWIPGGYSSFFTD